MFSLYKNIIGGNLGTVPLPAPLYRSDFSDFSIEEYLKQKWHLFSLPDLPLMSPANDPKYDTLFVPYDRVYIEGLQTALVWDDYDAEKDEFQNPGTERERRGAFIRTFDLTKAPSNIKEIKAVKAIDPNVRYLIVSECFHQVYGRAVHMPFGLITGVTEHGVEIDSKISGFPKKDAMPKDDSDQLFMWVEGWKNYVVSFLRFINLSNITAKKETLPHKVTKHLQQHKMDQTHYHILQIHKPTMTRQNIIQKQTGESCRPLHQVRGHLADYTKGKGLFGKYNIRVWISDHWRGDLEYGQIGKDYSITKN